MLSIVKPRLSLTIHTIMNERGDYTIYYRKNGTSQIGTCIILWLANTLSCDMTEPYLQRGEVLICKTLYFSNRAKNHAISVTPPLLITITQDCFTVKIISLHYITDYACRKPQHQFGGGSSRSRGIIRVSIWEVLFF